MKQDIFSKLVLIGVENKDNFTTETYKDKKFIRVINDSEAGLSVEAAEILTKIHNILGEFPVNFSQQLDLKDHKTVVDQIWIRMTEKDYFYINESIKKKLGM